MPSLGDLIISVRAETREAVAGFSNLLSSVKSLIGEGMRLAQSFMHLQDIQLRIEAASNRVADAQRRVQRIEEDLRDARERLRAASEAIASLEAKREQALKDYEAALEAVRKAEQELAEAKATCGAKSDEAKAKEQALKDARKALTEAEKELSSITKELDRAKREAAQASEEEKRKSEDLKAAQEDLRLAQERLNNAHQSLTMAGAQLGMTFLTMISHLFTLRGATEGATIAQHGLNAAMAANPIGAVITAISILITVFITLYQTCEPFRNAINALWETLSNFFKPIIDAIIGALTWLWNNVLVPLGQFIAANFVATWKALGAAWEWLKGVWDGFINALTWGYNTFIKPIVDALSWFYNNIVKPLWEFSVGVWQRIGEAFGSLMGGGGGGGGGGVPSGFSPYGYVPKMQHGGIITSPTLALLGEAGPEAVIPLERFNPAPSVQINAPLVYVEGSADEKTVRKAVGEIERMLKTVLVEASSRAAPTKRIRLAGGII